MDFSKGIPSNHQAMVVIPCLLSSKKDIEELAKSLEVRYLANQDTNLYFALLTDFLDAEFEFMTKDSALLKLVSTKIHNLNEKYKQYNEPNKFFLFHRPRKWNDKDKIWMGYERKRGKLSALNKLLRGHGESEFLHIVGNYQELSGIKYIITLDSDTELPREAAWKVIATMAHPLNKAVYDFQKKRVTEGYGILQPRVASLFPKDTSLYLRMQGDMKGVDPYTRASSDVYQDIFGEGSFIGKGIYDIDVFEMTVGQTFQDNRILSHDLLEGCYARSGLLSDVLLYEQNPSQYKIDIKRHQRWIRGDWQIAAWLLPIVPDRSGKFTRNPISVLSKWKILDNLRRSLIPLSLLLILLLGWSILPYPWFWTLAVTIIVLLPVIAAAILQLIRRPEELNLKAHIFEVWSSLRDVLEQFIFGLAVLHYEAFRYTGAILITHWRMLVSKQKLLEWDSYALANRYLKHNIWSNYRTMWIGPLLSIVCICIFLYSNHPAFFVASPILILWILAPAIAWRLSIPELEEVPRLTESQKLFLHKAARRTWSYFQEFVNDEDNWLPPDNFQEHPEAVIAHRTSPTNMGMSLLANLTAYDFGYIPASEMIMRCNNSLQTMLKMERFQGHFYNWYNTQSLLTLSPRYVSTVDSGNLLGSLLVLRQGLLSLPDQPIFNLRSFEGLNTTVEILKELSRGQKNSIIEKILTLLDEIIHEKSNTLSIIKINLDKLILLSNELTFRQMDNEKTLESWTSKLRLQVENLRSDLAQQVPWLELLPVPGHFIQLQLLDYNLSPLSIQEMVDEILTHIQHFEEQNNNVKDEDWLKKMRDFIKDFQDHYSSKITLIKEVSEYCEQLSTIEYDFLFEKSTNLLRIGFNVDEQRKDNSYYDMLASEARLGVFIGISQGKLPQESWFSLSRLLTSSNAGPILLSWSGSMFEYLMPQLLMPNYESTLLDQTNIATVKQQIEYGKKRGVPWGISESGYNSVDANLNYQYRAFGVPGLGLKRGLEDDLVIAPYASMLALMVSPGKAASNLQILSLEGFEGEYGFYEAVDYTQSRLPRGSTHVVINSYMTHHQGMSLLSMAYVLLNKPMQQRFLSELRFQATLLLLQERIPKISIFYAHTADISEIHPTISEVQIRIIKTPNTLIPEVQLLSNGRYQVMITNSGGGYSRWKNLSVTRWREDSTLDNYGIFCYIKDVNSGRLWSNTYHPTLHPSINYEAIFSQGHVEFRRQDYNLFTKTEIVISPEDDTEMRKIKITNRTQTTKTLEITSYSEIVIASQASDESHPAFSNLFIQTEIMQKYRAIFATRRPRSENEQPPHLFHLMDVYGASIEDISYETDRMQFIGRGRTIVHPQAIDGQLSGRQGSVLDPIMAIRYRISLRPNQTANIDLVFGISETRESAEALMHKYRDHNLKKRAFELAWTHSQVLLRQIKATEADAQLFGKLASSIIYGNPNFRADASIINSNLKGQSGLWGHSISGDLPIVLLQIYNHNSIDFVIKIIQAHVYWQLKGLAVDLIIWNEDHGAYRHELQDQIVGMISSDAGIRLTQNQPGDIYVKSSDQISSEDRVLFESVAHVILDDKGGTLSEQITRHYPEKILPPLLELYSTIPFNNSVQLSLPEDLLFFNGTGGFTANGKEYKIIIDKQATPAPWVNVIANPYFGSVLSETGSAYTWALNAHEYRITPWSNDPVSDVGGEAFYLRDEETGQFWSPCPFPAAGDSPYITTHGFGYTKYKHVEKGIHCKMKVFVDNKWPIKFIIIKIENRSGRTRKLSATGYLEIILGDVRSKTNMHILSEYDNKCGALLFRNRYNSTFAERVSFFKVSGGSNLSFTTDRSEFIGRNRNLLNPEALNRKKLSGRVRSGMDTCAALQVNLELLDGEKKEIIFQIGNESNIMAVETLIEKFTNTSSVKNSFSEVLNYWNDVLNTVQIITPDDSLNILANGWLTYQTIASRLFARSGFYQSGGAFGFRDQLQDVLSILHSKPELAREQILLNASRQFIEGDVQHWWHPPEGRGVRTHCSDDLLWLPFVVSRYLKATGDIKILNEPIGYLESRLLHEGEDSLYDLPVSGNIKGSLYEHCVRAIQYSLRFGKHGIPLIGSGDWNDGMDQVGNKGYGESVWLGFFLYDILIDFVAVARRYGDTVFANTCKIEAKTLQSNIETWAWDGEWYKRAWFDDGTPLGSKENEECKIDAISQSWSVLSSAAPIEKRVIAMNSLNKYLVKRDIKIIQLLEPPFDTSKLNPGYIKGYVPGVRENGGQYSHAAIWTLMAFANLGDREKVYELFNMIQPINHSLDARSSEVYRVEPYVMAADVYANKSHRGRGGWTWYTGSSGWMYQFILNSMIGLEFLVDNLRFVPCFPLDWPSVYIEYRFRSSRYKITVYQDSGITESWCKVDEIQNYGDTIQLIDDGNEHLVEVRIRVK
jgi:cellobiose phosphorylase